MYILTEQFKMFCTEYILGYIERYMNCVSLSHCQCAIIISKVTLTFYETTNIDTEGGKEGETSKML